MASSSQSSELKIYVPAYISLGQHCFNTALTPETNKLDLKHLNNDVGPM